MTPFQTRRPDLQTQDAAVDQMDRQAEEQDFIAKQQRDNARMQAAQEEAAREAARAQKAALANAKRQGVKVAPDDTGAETIQRHEDGAPVYEAGFVGEPQINDKGGAVAYRDARGQRYDVPFDAIRSEPDPTGETFYSFDVSGPDGTKQTMRQPAGSKPLFRVDPGTGSRIVDVTDPATGSVQPRIVGVDPLVANKAAIEKRKNAAQLAQNERSGTAEELRLQLAQRNTLLQPVAEKLKAAQEAADKIAKARTSYEQAADGYYAVTTLGDGVEPMRRKVDAPQEIATADSWVKNRDATEKALMDAKSEYDPAAAEIQTMQERRDALALETLRENRRMQAEIRRMEEAAKAGKDVTKPDWQKRAESLAADPRMSDLATVADMEAAGDPLAPDVQAAALPETAKMFQRVWSAGFQGQPKSLLQGMLDGVTAMNPGQKPQSTAEAQQLAAKSLGISDPASVSIEANPLGHFELRFGDDEFASYSPANNRITIIATAAGLNERAAELIANADKDGVPVYLSNTYPNAAGQPFNSAELRGLMADGLAAVQSADTQEVAESALAAAGLSSDDIRGMVRSGKLSVQDGRMMLDKFHGVDAVNYSRPAIEQELGRVLSTSTTAKADWEAGNKADVINRVMDGIASKATSGVVVDRGILEQRRQELLAQHVQEGAVSKAGGFLKELIMPMVGIGGQAAAYVPQKLAKWSGYETEAGRLSEQQWEEWQKRTGSFIQKMQSRGDVLNSLNDLKAWAQTANPGDTPPDDLAEKIAGTAYDGYHELTDDAAKALNTSRDTFNINRDPMLRAAMSRYLTTADPAAFEQLSSLLMLDGQDRKTQAEVSAYISAPRVATPADVVGRAKGLGIDLTPDKANALMGLTKRLESADEKAAQGIITQAGKILGLEGPEAAETFARITADETDDPESAWGLLKGGFIAGRQELVTEIASTAAEAGLAWVTAGAATPEIMAERAARQGIKTGIRAAIRRQSQAAFTKLADSSTAFAKTSAALGKARQTVGTGLANMGEAFAKAGVKPATFGQPLTRADNARNALVQVGKNAAAAAPMEALEEGIASIGEPDPNAASIGEQMLMGAAGGLVLTPMFAGAAAVGQAWKNRGAGAEWEKRKAGYVEELNRRMEKVPGFKPLTVADFDAWQGLQDNPAQAQAAASYREALSTFEQELALHQEAAAGNSSLPLTPELLAARVQLDGAAKDLELATSSAFMAMDELRGIPEAERPLYTAAAKAASGARDFTEAEAKALMAQGGNNAVVFQQAQVMPADVAGPPAQRTVGAPAVSNVAPGVYRLPAGVRVDVPPALLDSLVQKAPTMVDLLRQPANQTPAVQAVVTQADAKKQAMPKAGKTAPATPAETQAAAELSAQAPAMKALPKVAKKRSKLLATLKDKGVVVRVVNTAAEAEAILGKKVSKGRKGVAQSVNGVPHVVLIGEQSVDAMADTLDHEAIHGLSLAFAAENPELHAAAMLAVDPASPEFDAALNEFMRREYNGYDKLSPRQKFEEALRAIVEGRWKGRTSAKSKGFKKFLKAFLAYVRGLMDGNQNAALKQIVANIETALQNEPNNQTPVQPQQSGGQNMPQPGSVPVVPVQPPAQAPTPGANPAGTGAVAPTGQPLPAKAIEKVTREAIGRIAAKSPRIKALLKESKRANRYPTGGMWLEPDGKVAFHVPTIIQQLESIGVTDNATAGKRVEALLDEEIRHSANMEAARRLFAGEQAAGRVLRGMSFETWRDAWYGDIWNSHFTDAMRQAVQEAYGDTLPEQDWMRAMEGLRMLDQLRATGSITEAVLLALDAILESLREFLDLVTAGGKQVVEAEIMAIREVLAEYGYEGGTVKPDAKKKPAKPKAQKPEAAQTSKPADPAPEMSTSQQKLPILTVSDATSIKVASDPVDLLSRADAKGMVKISETSFNNAQTGEPQKNITFEFRTAEGMRRVTFRDDGPRDPARVAAGKQPAYRFSPVLDQNSQAIPPATTQTADVQDQTEAQGQRQTQEVLNPVPEAAPAQGAADGLPPVEKAAPGSPDLAQPTIPADKHWLFDTQGGDVAAMTEGRNVFIVAHFTKLKDAKETLEKINQGKDGPARIEAWLAKPKKEGGKVISKWAVFIPNVTQDFVDEFNAIKARDQAPKQAPLPAENISTLRDALRQLRRWKQDEGFGSGYEQAIDNYERGTWTLQDSRPPAETLAALEAAVVSARQFWIVQNTQYIEAQNAELARALAGNTAVADVLNNPRNDAQNLRIYLADQIKKALANDLRAKLESDPRFGLFYDFTQSRITDDAWLDMMVARVKEQLGAPAASQPSFKVGDRVQAAEGAGTIQFLRDDNAKLNLDDGTMSRWIPISRLQPTDAPTFKRGDRVTWTSGTKELSGIIRSVSSDGTASITTDQIAFAGGVPIGRIETVQTSRLKMWEEEKPANTSPEMLTPAEPSTSIAARIIAQVDELIAMGTNNGTKPMDTKWEQGAIKRLLADGGTGPIRAIMADKQNGEWATAKIAISKARTLEAIRAAVVRFEVALNQASKPPAKSGRFSDTAKDEARQQFEGLFSAPARVDKSTSGGQSPSYEPGIDSPAQLASYDELPDTALDREELAALTALRERFGSGVLAARPRQPLLAPSQTPREKESRRGALSGFQQLSEALRAVFGKRVLFVKRRGKPLPDNGYNVGTSRNVLAVDIDAVEPVNYLVGHELGHAIEAQSSDLYRELSVALLEMAGDTTSYRARLTALGYKESELDAEIVNDFIGSQFMEPAFWRDLAGRDKSLFERMADAAVSFIQSILRKASILSRDVRPLFAEIDKARALLVEVLTAYATDAKFPQMGALAGELSRSASGMKQQAIPADRLPGFIKLAQTLIAEGIRAPQDLAAFLEETFPGGKARPFSQALWNAVGMVSPDLSSTPDWTRIYGDIDQPLPDVQEPEAPSRDTSHLDAIIERLTRERQRLDEATTDQDRAFRQRQIAQAERELAAEYEFLGINPPQSDADILAALEPEAETPPTANLGAILAKMREVQSYVAMLQTSNLASDPNRQSKLTAEVALDGALLAVATGSTPQARAELQRASDALFSQWPTAAELVDDVIAMLEPAVAETPTNDLATDPIRDLILSDDSRAKKAQAMKKLAEERGETLKQTQEYVESRLVQIADEVARNGNDPAGQFLELVDIYDKQPLFSARTSTSMENQAYSTPAPMSFALRHMTGVTPQTSVYDATAGNGMLTIGADLKNSVANEIDETRLEGLRRLGIGTITTQDATDPTGAFKNRPKAQTVHLNPPFGGIPNVNFDGYGIRKLEHIISLQALKEGMADNGTAAIILGDTMNNQEQVKGAQWVFENYLYAHYNVVDNFSVSGDLYGNQGAKWPVRILVIAGKKAVPTRNQDLAPKTVDRLDTWPDVWARAERTRNEVERQRQTLGTDGQTTAPSGNPAGNAGTANTRPIPDSQRPAASTSSGTGVRGGNAGGQSRPGATGTGGSGLATPGTTEQPADAGASVQPATGGRKPAASMGGRGGRRPSSATNAASGSSQTGGGTDPSGQDSANAGSIKRPERRKAEATATQVPYDPASSGMPFETLVPRGIGESLQTALAEIVANRGPIDQYVADQLDMSAADLHKAMAAEQIDGVAMAIYQMETGGALIIGDETGIGKGRQAASLIRFAILKGKIPVFFTKDPKLFSDMWGDLKDIGTTVTGPNASASDMSVRPLVLGDSEKAQIKTPDNVVVLKPASNARQSTVFAAARENGFASTGHNAIFATYSQIRDPNARQEFLEWLAANDDVVVVLDEAHESAGDGETSMQAAFMMGGTVKRGKGSNKTEITKSGLLNGPGAMHPRGGVAYLSATFAKRPDNMPVYFRTDLRKGADKFSQVVEAMDKGGVALQQAITEALAEAGQYTRRERDFTGVSYAMKQVTVRDEAELVRQVDAVTNVLSAIANFSKLIRAAVEDSTARTDSQSSMTDFASIVHNQVSQLLLAAKADAVVDEVVEAHKRGEKPIVALMNTMESFLSQYVEDMNIKPGQPMKLNWAALLEYALSRTLRASEKQPNGDTVIYTVDPAEHGLGMAYQRVLSAARAVNVAFPVSPIDYIIQKSRAGGVEVGELTGRESGIDYTNFQTGEGTYRKFKRADKNTLVNTFNNGSLAGMLLNASGSTGLSIHAASKFKDQKPRHMIIAQPALDINVFIQTLGRIKRTGIVLLGRYPDGSAYGARYSHLTLPLNSELRPAIMAARKMKSLNANTTGESDSAVKIEAEDLMNRFGNQVVAEYLSRNPELQDALNIEVEEKEDGTVVAPKDIARKFTGRMALQPNKVQGEAYAEIITDYRRAIEQAKVTGDYDLEIIVHEDWDATRGASEQIVAGTDESSIFTSSVNVELWDMTDNRPTPSGADMLAEFTKENGSREQLDARWQDFSRQVDERLEGLEQRLRQRLAEASGKLAGMSPDDPAHKGLEREVASLERNLSGVSVKKARWRDTQRRLDDIIDSAGRPVTLENAETQEMDHGMMTQIRFPDITGQLRIAPSAFKLTYLLNRPGGRIYPTLAQFKQDGYTQAESQYSLEDMTGDRGGRRERRTLLVGSPIRAYGATGGKGKVVRFKARDGSLVTGILMPRNWNISNLAEDPRKELADPGAVENYMRDLGWTAGFIESGDSVRIHATNGSFRISAPSARRTGGGIFLDDQLREIVGDFFRNGQRMTARIDSISDVPRVAARVMQLTGKRFKGQDVARVRKANGVDENADIDSPARTAKPKSIVKAAATEAWNSYLDEGGTSPNPSVNQISRDQWLNRIDEEEGRSLRSAPVRSTFRRAKDFSYSGIYEVDTPVGVKRAFRDPETKAWLNPDVKAPVGSPLPFEMLGWTKEEALQKLLQSDTPTLSSAPVRRLGRGLADMLPARPQTGPLAMPNIAKAYRAVQQGQSSVMVPIRAVFQRMKSATPEITPAQFMAEIQAADERGDIMVEAPERPETLQQAGPFVVRNALGVPSTNMMVVDDDRGGDTGGERPPPTHIMPDGYQLTGPGMHMLASAPVRAYHGTPHKVDKFKLDKIGTGEGAQAFGWGLYFAEALDVAEKYRRDLAINGTRSNFGMISMTSENTLSENDVSTLLQASEWPGDVPRHRAYEWEEAAKPGGEGVTWSEVKEYFERYTSDEEAERALMEIAEAWSFDTPPAFGNLYTVELLPDADEFLDWDKPLSEQKNPKLDALKKQHRAFLQDPAQRISDKGKNGDSLYHMVTRQKGSEKAASEYLASLGIPGIRYLDGGSRGAGDGTRNYVIFDENLVRILEENGKPVSEAPLASAPVRSVTPDMVARHTELEAKHKAGTITPAEVAEARKLVEQAAKLAGFDEKAFHGSPNRPFWVFDPLRKGERTGSNSALLGFFASSSQEVASQYRMTERERSNAGYRGPLAHNLEDAEAKLARAEDIEVFAEYDDDAGGYVGKLRTVDQYGSEYTYDADPYDAWGNGEKETVFDDEDVAIEAAQDEKDKTVAKAQKALDDKIAEYEKAAKDKLESSTLHDLFLKLENPLIYDFDGGSFKDKSYSELVQEAIDGGYDGVIMENTNDAIDDDTTSDVFVFFRSSQAKLADPFTGVPLNERFDSTQDSILRSAPAPKPNRATQAMRDIIEALPPPHREVLRDLLVNGMSIADAATTHGISETAVGNILRRGEAHIRLMLERSPTKPTVRVQDGVVKATDGRPDLAMSGNAAVAAVDQRRMTPEEVTHAEMQELATRLFDVAPAEAENLVVRWMDSGTTVLSTEGMPDGIKAIVNEAQARNAAEMLMTSAAKMLVARKTLEGGNSTQLARLIYLYRNTGTEQARALGMRRDPFDTPEERAAMYLSEALLTPPDAIKNELRRNPANRDRILAAWSKRADQIKAEMLAHGIDLDATFADHAEEQKLVEETIPEPVKPVLARAPKKTRQLVKAILQGMTPAEAIKAAGLSAKAAFKAYQDFRATLTQTGTEAAQAMRDQLLRSAPAPGADFAANLGLPDLTEAEWLDAVENNKPLRTTPETEKLKQHREKAKKAGTLDLKNPNSTRKAKRAIQERKSTTFDKWSEFWRASILSGPQTHVVNIVSGLTYGAYEASFKKLAAGVQGDIARMFGAKPDAASLADVPAMIAAVLPSIREAFTNSIASWKSETSAFDSYAMQLQDDNGELFKEDYKPALKGTLGKVMRGISFRLMGAADEFVKSFFTRIEVVAQARQIARNEGKTGLELARTIQELMEPGSLAWERALAQAKRITFQNEEVRTENGSLKLESPLTAGDRAIDAIDGLAQLISRTKKGDFGKPLKGLAHFTFPFVDTPTNIFKAGVTMSPVGGLLALVDMIRSYNRRRKGNAEEAAKIYNAARALDDLTNQIVAWGFIMGLSSLVKPGDDEDETPFITGTIPWRSTSPGERELAYRTAPPQSIRIGDRWISYKRLDPFASALAFTVDAIREFQSGKPIDEVWTKIALGMARNMQDKTFLQGISDVVNAVQDPERFGTKWATNIATGFIPNLIRQPIRTADDVFRETDLPNDLGFWDSLGRRMGYGIYPQGAMPAITVWGQPARKDTGTGGPNTDWMIRLLSPADMRAANVDMLDVALLRYNATHQDGDPKALFGVTAPSRELQRTIGGQVIKVSLDDAEYEDFITKSGQAARQAIGSTYDGRDLTEADVERIKDILQRTHGVYRDAAFVQAVQKRGGMNALANTTE